MASDRLKKEAKEYALVDEIKRVLGSSSGHTVNGLELFYLRRGLIEPGKPIDPDIARTIHSYNTNLTSTSDRYKYFVANYVEPERKEAIDAVAEDPDDAIRSLSQVDSLINLLLARENAYGKSDIAKAHDGALKALKFLKNGGEGLEKKIEERIDASLTRLKDLKLPEYAVNAAKGLYDMNRGSLVNELKREAQEAHQTFTTLVKDKLSDAQKYVGEIYKNSKDPDKEELAADIALEFNREQEEEEKKKAEEAKKKGSGPSP